MLLSHRHKFLFVHIAKTGGTSVRAALSRLLWTDPYYLPRFVCSRLSHLTGHRIGTKFPRHAKIIAAKEMLPEDFFQGLFKFAIVRNPWDLQVSSYHHLRRERPYLLSNVDSFASFIQFKLDPQRPYQYHLDTSIESQRDYLIDLEGNIIADYVGRYEQLEEDYQEICKRIGVTAPSLPHKRRASDRKDYRSYYDDNTAELVSDYFKRDIEAFDYRFDDNIV